MSLDSKDAPKRVSRIVLIKENQILVLNDRYRISYKHYKTFLLIWIVCRALKENESYKTMKGIPPDDLQQFCGQECFVTSTTSINTRWYDEVQLRRHTELVSKLYEVTDLKSNECITTRKNWLPRALQLIFPSRVPPPKNSKLDHRTRLYTVTAEPEQILLFSTRREARQNGFEESGASDVTRYRSDAGIVGFLDWAHHVEVDDEGSAFSTICVKMVNLSSIPLSHYMLPLWFDFEEDVAKRNVRAALKDGTQLPVRVLIGNKDSTRIIEFLISFPQPIETGTSIEFIFNYQAPQTYKEGKEHFEWFFGQPHTRYSVDLCFSKSWVAEYPTVFCGTDVDWFSVEQISRQHLRWIRYFPVFSSTYRLEFILKHLGK